MSSLAGLNNGGPRAPPHDSATVVSSLAGLKSALGVRQNSSRVAPVNCSALLLPLLHTRVEERAGERLPISCEPPLSGSLPAGGERESAPPRGVYRDTYRRSLASIIWQSNLSHTLVRFYRVLQLEPGDLTSNLVCAPHTRHAAKRQLYAGGLARRVAPAI
jgi:hypothetical protein